MTSIFPQLVTNFIEKSNSDACEMWYESAVGGFALTSIQDQLADTLSRVFGYYAIECGALSGNTSLLKATRVKSSFALGNKKEGISFAADPAHWPIDFDSVDLVVGSHLLECSEKPHQILREIDRVLVSHGSCILIGFNPLSPWVSARRLSKLSTSSQPIKLYSVHKMQDWFSLLGWETKSVHYLSHRPGFLKGKLFDRAEKLETLGSKYNAAFGSLYIIHAEKMEVIKPPRLKEMKSRMSVLPGKVVLPAAPRNVQNRDKPHE